MTDKKKEEKAAQFAEKERRDAAVGGKVHEEAESIFGNEKEEDEDIVF